MKVKIVFDINADTREAIAHHYGWAGYATYKMCKGNIGNLVECHFEDLVNDLDKHWRNVMEGDDDNKN